MYKSIVALALAMASVAPGKAATTVILSPPGTTTLPSYTTATVIQNFNTPNPNNTAFAINTTNVSTDPNSPAGTESIAGTVRTRNGALSGMTEDYLTFAENGSRYTISFGATPVAFFSFAFNGAAANGNALTLTYVGGTTQLFNRANDFGHSSDLPTFGRLSYDVGTGPRIVSAAFTRTNSSADNRWNIDDIAVAAPEPATWLMMILGFGLVGIQLRRRKGEKGLSAA